MQPYWQGELASDEGTRLFVYDDATGERIAPGYLVQGHPTIGTGRALDVHGITAGEAAYLFTADVAACEAELTAKFPGFAKLTPGRQFALVSMRFNLGMAGLLEFPVMLASMWAGNYMSAAIACLNSAAARELPARYRKLAYCIRNGNDTGYVP